MRMDTPTPEGLSRTPARRTTLRPRGAERRVARALGVPVCKESVVSLVITQIQDALLRKELRPGDYFPA